MKKWLIIYDICDPRRLHKVAKYMTGYATRVQKSVFEMEAPDHVVRKMRFDVLRLMDEEKDFVVYFNICEADWQKRVKYGPELYEVEEEKPFYIY
jgi:CRISPR-associated protein Cas2